MMKRILAFILSFPLLLLAACTGSDASPSEAPSVSVPAGAYLSISAQDAKSIMDTTSGYLILDVREQDEYDSGHIPNAVLLPYTEIEAKASSMLPDPEQVILVYCRSGRRSKIASQTLAELGYTRVLEFGGILDWPYETEN